MLRLKREISLLCIFLNSYMLFGVRKDVLRTVLAYLCGTNSFKVFIVLITATPVETWSKGKGLCSRCEGTGDEFER